MRAMTLSGESSSLGNCGGAHDRGHGGAGGIRCEPGRARTEAPHQLENWNVRPAGPNTQRIGGGFLQAVDHERNGGRWPALRGRARAPDGKRHRQGILVLEGINPLGHLGRTVFDQVDEDV